MASRHVVLLSTLVILLGLSAIFLAPESAYADPQSARDSLEPSPSSRSNSTQTALTILNEFIAWLTGDKRVTAMELILPETEGLSVVQQPKDQPNYVSLGAAAVTQFELASDHGSVGLLAHNYLAGMKFFDLEVGQRLSLVTEDGPQTYVIAEVLRVEALRPYDPYSSFRLLDGSEEILTSTDLFRMVYGGRGRLILQTCIEANGNPNWGRLFVIANPYEVAAHLAPLTVLSN
jgi:hypothetical protein